ncbi:MAG: hypothetical protein JXX28_06115 [Deltaproteobacteria bacterium]|nr:hypothetical protein [Deltaproteobacteria bacterium]
MQAELSLSSTWGALGEARLVAGGLAGARTEDWGRWLPSDTRLAEARVLGRGTVSTAALLVREERDGAWIEEAWVALGPVRAGRQRVDIGHGVGFDPIDLFQAQRPLDPDLPQRGVDALILAGARGGWGGRALVRLSEAGPDLQGWGGWESERGGVHAVLQRVHRERTRWRTLNTSVGLTVAAMGDPDEQLVARSVWTLAGAEGQWTLGSVRAHAQAGWVWAALEGDDYGMEREGWDHLRALAGLEVHPGRWSLFAEGLLLGAAPAHADEVELEDRLAVPEGAALALGRQTLLAGVELRLGERWRAGSWGMLGLEGALLSPRVRWQVGEGLALDALGWAPIGEGPRAGLGGQLALTGRR